MRRSIAVLALVLAVAAAGCLGPDPAGSAPDPDPPSESDPDDPADGDDEPEGFVTPTWSAGLWWRYEVTRDGETGSVTFAVQEKGDGTYTLLANTTDHAALDAVVDLAYVGPVRTSDLAGLVDGEPVRFFEWPLRDGRTWTTTWNGLERTHEARRTDVEIAGGTFDGAEITSTAGDRTLATYAYAPAVGWFTRLEIPDRNLSYQLEDAGFAYGGNLTRAEASTALEAASPAVQAGPFTVPEEAARVSLEVAGGGESTSYEARLLDPNGTQHEYGPEACSGCQVDLVDLLPARPGEWSAELTLASDPPGNLTARVDVVTAANVSVRSG